MNGDNAASTVKDDSKNEQAPRVVGLQVYNRNAGWFSNIWRFLRQGYMAISILPKFQFTIPIVKLYSMVFFVISLGIVFYSGSFLLAQGLLNSVCYIITNGAHAFPIWMTGLMFAFAGDTVFTIVMLCYMFMLVL